MKKILSLVLILTMVLGSFGFTFAADAPYQRLVDFGVLIGDGSGNLMLDQTLTREQYAVFATRLLGFSDEEVRALNEKSPFEDVSGPYAPFIGKAFKENLVAGRSATKFDPKSNVSYVESLIIILRALGYGDQIVGGANWKQGNMILAATLGLVNPSIDMDAKITRAQMADTLLIALDTETKAGVRLAVALGFEKPEEPPVEEPVVVVPATLEVVSVSAINLKEIQVTFNKEVDVTRSNFLVDGAIVEARHFALSEDGKVVTLFNNNSTIQGQRVRVTIQNVEGLSLQMHDVILNDVSIPAIENVEVVGNSLIRITFTEPMQAGVQAASNFLINNTVRSATVTMSNRYRVANLELATALPDGEYTLRVNANNVRDFAGFSLGVNETPFTVARDAAVPGYTVLSATQQRVVIQFDRQVRTDRGANMVLRRTVGSTNFDSAAGTRSAVNPTIWTFTFSDANRLPAGENNLVIRNVVDFSGNVRANYPVSLVASVDTERPVLESVTQVSATVVEFKFSKPVVANRNNFIFRDAQNVVFSGGTAGIKATDNTVVVITFTTALNAERSPYTIEIRNVIDTTYLANMIQDTVYTLTITDSTLPELAAGPFARLNRTISIVFTKDIDQSSVSLANFRYAMASDTGSYFNMPSAAFIEFVGTRTVNITFPAQFGPGLAHTAASIHNIHVADVRDLAGNKMLGTMRTVQDAANQISIIGNVVAINPTTLLFAPAQPLANVFVGDFVATNNTILNAELVIADEDVNRFASTTTGNPLGFTAGQQLVRLTLQDAMTADRMIEGAIAQLRTVAVADNQITRTALGTPLVFGATNVVDRIIPGAIVAGNFTWNNTTNVVSISNPFIVNEEVEIQYFVTDATTGLPTAATGAGINTVAGGRTQVYAATPTFITVGGIVEGQRVYLRTIDEFNNRSAWVQVGRKIPVAPLAQFVFDANSTTAGTLSAVTTAHEYSIDGGTTWLSVASGTTVALTGVTAENNIRVRVRAVDPVPAGAVQIININPQPAAPTVVSIAGAVGETRLVGTTTGMEYSLDNGTSWITASNTETVVTTTAGATILVRVAATPAGTNNIAPAGAITTLTAVVGI